MRSLITIAMVLVLFFGGLSIMDARAQEDAIGGGVVKTVKTKMTPAQFIARFVELGNQDGTLRGPFDIIVGTTDKGAGGMKYSNVPFAILLGDGSIAFPNGDKGKGGKAVLVLTSNWTLRTK